MKRALISGMAAALAITTLTGCAGIDWSPSPDNGGYLYSGEHFNEAQPWSPRTAVFTQRTFDPRDPHHGW
jgi:hypothetical protein